jgi:hypothetical protein
MNALWTCLGLLLLAPAAIGAEDLASLVDRSPLIFRGTILSSGAAAMPDLKPANRLLKIRVSEVFRSSPTLGRLKNTQLILMKRDDWPSRAGGEHVFFATSLRYGHDLAVREIGHLEPKSLPRDVNGAIAAAAVVAEDRKIAGRLVGAELVAIGRVRAVRPPPQKVLGQRPTRNAPEWREAMVEIESVEKGHVEGKTVTVLFPTARSWKNSPKFVDSQEGIWILRRQELRAFPAHGNLTALDPLDFRPASEAERIRRLVKTAMRR